jgi:hypothetical protein
LPGFHRRFFVKLFESYLLITSSRQVSFDDSILLSFDFPGDTKVKDLYRISGPPLVLEADVRKRICSGLMKSPTLAIAVSSHRSHDIVTVLCRDGMRTKVTTLNCRSSHAFPAQRETTRANEECQC